MTHVLITYPGVIPSILLCGQYQLMKIAGEGKIEVRSANSSELTPQLCGWADVIFMIRSDSELELDLAMKWNQTNKRIVYVLDDDLLQVPKYCPCFSHYAQPGTQRSIGGLIAACDRFLSPSENLRAKYGANKAGTVIEPTTIFRKEPLISHDPVRIGFAGSLDRTKDIDDILAPAISALIERYGNKVSFEFFGACPDIAKQKQLKFYPYTDSYSAYQETMVNLDWDIGLAPMPQTPFHSCKHYNKFIEYSGLGIAGVYSAVEPYTQVIRNMENGILCANTLQAWIEALSLLIENETLRISIAQHAQAQAYAKYSVEAAAHALENELGDLLSYIAPSHNPVRLNVRKRAKHALHRLRSAYLRYGFKLPIIAVKRVLHIL